MIQYTKHTQLEFDPNIKATQTQPQFQFDSKALVVNEIEVFITACVTVVLTGSTATKTPLDDSYDSHDDDIGYRDPVSTDTEGLRYTRYILADQRSPLLDPAESSTGSSKFVASKTSAEFVS